MFMSMVGLNAYAHNIEVKNADGVTIYYNFINNNTELAVTYRGFDYSSYSNEYTGNVVIPESVTYNEKTYSVKSIGEYAFNGCSGLTSVTIPNSVTSVGQHAFYGCSGLTSVTIGSGVTSIGGSAFSGCSSLYSVTIPNSVTSIGSYAFDGCSGLQKVIVPDIAAWCGINFGDATANPLYYVHHLYSDKSTEITELVIPDGVTSIGKVAFYNCSGLTSVTIPNSVTSIGDGAFFGCSGLTSVTIGSGVTSIGSYAFRSCSGLTSVTIPNSVTSIGERAFNGCSGLKKVIVPDIAAWCGIKFGEYANPLYYAHHLYSDDNTEITALVIPDGVTSIGSEAFESCSGLTSVTIGSGVTSIGSGAFYGCSKLASVTFHCNNVGTWFSGKSSIKEVWIEKEVISIAQESFAGCSGLQSVYNNAEDAFIIVKNTFDDATYSSATLYVPTGMKATYEETPWWLNFNKKEEYDFPTGITIPQQSKDVKVVDAYQINGLKTGSMQKGLNILKMSDGTTRKVVK
jgi:hypothetical protein